MTPAVHTKTDSTAIVEFLARKVTELARACQSERGRFVLALSGGSTPRPLYERLAEATGDGAIDWSTTYVFLSDERCVPHSSPESNFSMIERALLSKIEIPPANVFATRYQDSNPEKSASDYEERLLKLFPDYPPGRVPPFDLILLGLGTDGHTASLFPDTPALEETRRLCVANPVKQQSTTRITFTYPLIKAARQIYFLVTGEGKADIVKKVVTGSTKRYPAQIVSEQACHESAAGKVEWYLDEKAAAALDPALSKETMPRSGH